MNRREFTALVGARIIFPRDFVKALADAPKEKQNATHWYCIGDDENPASPEDLNLVDECLLGKREWTLEVQNMPRIVYEITLPPERWVIVVGNNDRPASRVDVEVICGQLAGYLAAEDWHELTIVTPHTAYPCIVPEGSILHHVPMVIPHKGLQAGYPWVAENVASGHLQKVPPMMWNGPWR